MVGAIAATCEAEQAIIEDKRKQGINGFEWLIMQVVLDEKRKESLNGWLQFSPLTAKKKVDSLTFFSDAVRLNADEFYKIYELNWWMAFDEALTYFALMKERNYDMYFDALQDIFSKEKEEDSA